MKTCECGCGQPTTIAKRSDKRHGYVKGQPFDFLRGHNIRNDQAPWFRGDDAGYRAIHTYLGAHFPKSGTCDECGETKPIDYALIKGREYSRERDDYRELCRRCHVAYDETGGSRWHGVETARRSAGEAPSCGCGCGTAVAWDCKHARWRRFLKGHYRAADHLNSKVVA